MNRFTRRVIREGEPHVKITAYTETEIDGVLDVLETRYDIIESSQLKENDRDDGFHILITLKRGVS